MDGAQFIQTLVEEVSALRAEARELLEDAKRIHAQTLILLRQQEEHAHELARVLQATFKRLKRPMP